MGYTHYFSFKPVRGQAKQNETKYQKAILECQRIILTYYRENGGLSGYSAHTKLGQYGGIKFNGKGEDAHEDFTLREHCSENEGFNFCKTAQKSYDVVVTACLAVLAYRPGDAVEISSDGDAGDWTDGVELARRILKLKIKNPIQNNTCPKCGAYVDQNERVSK